MRCILFNSLLPLLGGLQCDIYETVIFAVAFHGSICPVTLPDTLKLELIRTCNNHNTEDKHHKFIPFCLMYCFVYIFTHALFFCTFSTTVYNALYCIHDALLCMHAHNCTSVPCKFVH